MCTTPPVSTSGRESLRAADESGTAVAVTTNTAIAGPAAIIAIEALTALNQAG